MCRGGAEQRPYNALLPDAWIMSYGVANDIYTVLRYELEWYARE